MSAYAFDRVTLDQLTIEDANAFKHVALFAELSAVLERDRYAFRVPPNGELSWDRAVFLNLAYWSDGANGGDVLVDRTIPADVVMHVAWHHIAAARLVPGEHADLMGEAIASAFDLYLVGRSLGHAESTFLDTQVPAMADAARAAGLDDEEMEELLSHVSADPDRAFEELRALLFEATCELASASDADAAMALLERRSTHRFAPLLHHYELASWVQAARARRAEPTRRSGPGRVDARELHEVLARADSSVEWLRDNWVAGAIQRG